MIPQSWHPDIPMVSWVNPGDDFIIETLRLDRRFIKNNDSGRRRARHRSCRSCISCPARSAQGAEPGDPLVVTCSTSARSRNAMWVSTASLQTKWRRLLTIIFRWPEIRSGTSRPYTSSRHVPGVNFAGLIHPRLIGCLPDPKLLATWNERETALIATNPTVSRALPIAFAATAHAGRAR